MERQTHNGIERYRLGYPNREVRQSLNESLLDVLTGDESKREDRSDRLGDALRRGDLVKLETVMRALFAGIPYQWHTRQPIARYEGYYASVFYSYFTGLGVEVKVEDSGSVGRLDMAVLTGGRVYVFEFKVVEHSGHGNALQQLRDRRYADRFRSRGEPIHLVGVEFSEKARNVVAFETELA